jgi:hypothetical protein
MNLKPMIKSAAKPSSTSFKCPQPDRLSDTPIRPSLPFSTHVTSRDIRGPQHSNKYFHDGREIRCMRIQTQRHTNTFPLTPLAALSDSAPTQI